MKRRIVAAEEETDFETVAEIDYEYSDEPQEQFLYKDIDIEPGKKYDYMVMPLNSNDVFGQPAGVLRVTFIGESSVVERF